MSTDLMVLQPEPLYPAYENSDWMGRFCDMWLSPLHGLKRLSQTLLERPLNNPLPLEAVVIVLAISAMGPLVQYAVSGGDPILLMVQVILWCMGGVLTWLLSGLFLGMLAYAMTECVPWKNIFVLTAYALLPWIFLAPATLIKTSLGTPGAVIGGVLCMAVWLWSTWIYCYAVKTAFQMRITQLAVLLLLPLCLSLVWFAWVSGFIGNLLLFFSA